MSVKRRRAVLILGAVFAIAGGGFAAGWWSSGGPVDEQAVSSEPEFEQQSPAAAGPDGPGDSTWIRRVTTEAYIPIAKAASAAEIARFTDGAATVQIHGRLETFRLEDGRHPPTAEDVEEFAKLGKTVVEGQPVGPAGFVMTRFDATVSWIDGRVERAAVVVSGGVEDGTLYELADVPLPEAGKTYFFFLRRTAEGLVPEAVQFVVESDRLVPLTFPQSGLSKGLAGTGVAEAISQVAPAYADRAP